MGAKIPARTVIIATGAEYRRPQCKNLQRFEGAGVYYGATFLEAQMCVGEEVIVVGGGNSAGQAAVFLAQKAKRVHMLVRSAGLVESMSRYLIRRIEENPTIALRTHTEIGRLRGKVTWNPSGGKTAKRGRLRIKHQERVRHGRCCPEHQLAWWLRRPRPQRLHQDRSRSVARESWHCRLAPCPSAILA